MSILCSSEYIFCQLLYSIGSKGMHCLVQERRTCVNSSSRKKRLEVCGFAIETVSVLAKRRPLYALPKTQHLFCGCALENNHVLRKHKYVFSGFRSHTSSCTMPHINQIEYSTASCLLAHNNTRLLKIGLFAVGGDIGLQIRSIDQT